MPGRAPHVGTNSPQPIDRLAPKLHGRKYLSKDPAGYALQTLEVALLERGRSRNLVFTAPELALLELAPEIAKLPLERDRVAVIKQLLKHTDTNDSYRNYLVQKLPHLLYFATTRERISLLKFALCCKEHKARASLAFAILRSSRSSSELASVCSEKTSHQLLRLRHTELRELVAKALYLREFQRLKFPPGLSREVSGLKVEQPKIARFRVRERLLQLHHALKEHLKIIDQHPRLARTRTTREFKRSLKEALAIISPHVATNGGAPRHILSRIEGAKLANFLSLKVRTELTYAIHFARRNLTKGGHTRPWTISDIRAVLPAIKTMPQGHLSMTPLLNQFIRGTSKGAFGYRRATGIIEITDEHRRDHSLSRDFAGVNSSLVAGVHEMGHALQIGASQKPVTADRKTGEIETPADPLFDFASFCRLSGWRVITDKQWTIIFNHQAVQIGESMYPLNRPTVYEGNPTVFVSHDDGVQKHLLARSSSAQFAVRGYASSDPWEDWAEGFSEYMLTPKRYIVFAPEKFLFFHLHFRRYPEESELITSLYKQLRGLAS